MVVVGAGLAGAQTVAALRTHGFTGAITVLGAEGVPPYDRPPLSKELLSRAEPAWLAGELGVDVTALADDVRLADPAARLVTATGPTEQHVVVTRSGERLRADAVVLAVGSAPVRPAAWESALVLHTAAEAATLRAVVHPGQRLVVVGAGWIGAEVAGIAAGAGADVTVVEAGPAPLGRQLGNDVGAHLARWYAEAGARLVTDAAVVDVRPDGVGLAGGGRVPADVVLVAVGARPSTAWLDGVVPRDATGAITVDAAGAVLGRTRLWAVGDCATRVHPEIGAVPGGHWSAALHDPDATARAVVGLDPHDAPPHAPYVFSQQLGHDVALLGVREAGDDAVLRGDPSGGASGRDPWSVVYLDPTDHGRTDDAGRAVRRAHAVLLVDSPRDVGAVRRVVTRAPRPDVVLDLVADPTVRWRDVTASR